MIAYLEGEIIFRSEKFIILNVNGVGYKVFLSHKTFLKIPQTESKLNPVRESPDNDNSRRNNFSNRIKFFCYLHVRENVLDLYGFLNYEQLEFFEMLLDIPGVGPKAALEISDLGPLEKLKKAIEFQDEKIFEEISGIGRKKAQTIILELSGKIKEISKKKVSNSDEAEIALVSLGFPRQNVKEVLFKIPKEIKNTEARIKEALKFLGK